MAAINRMVEKYNFPQVVREVIVNNNQGVGRPFTTGQGTCLEGNVRLEFGLRTGNNILVSNPGVDIPTTLQQIQLTIQNPNRVATGSELTFTVLLPGNATVAASPYYGDVNAWIAAEILAGGTEMAELDDNGWTVSYLGNEVEGNLVLQFDASAADAIGAPMNAADDPALPYVPSGQWFVAVELVAWDGTDTYHWGDPDGTLDLIAAQDETDYDGVSGNGTFVGGDSSWTLILSQDETDYDGVGTNGTFTAGDASFEFKTGQDETDFDGSGTNGTYVGGDGLFDLKAAQDETDYDGAGGNGTFSAGTGYAATDTVTLSDGSVITVDAVSTGAVTDFTVTTPASGANPTGTLTQSSTSGGGSGFDLTPGNPNLDNVYRALDTITLADGTVVTVDGVDAAGDVQAFTVTTPFVGGSPSGAQTQSSTSGDGDGFTLTPGNANLDGVYRAGDTITLDDGAAVLVDAVDASGDVTDFTVTGAGSLPSGTLAQNSTSGDGNGFDLTPGTANFDGAYLAGDTITLSDGSVITVDTVDASYDVTEFTVTSSGAGDASGTLTQTSTSGTGDAFTLTPGTNNVSGGLDMIRELKYFGPFTRDLSNKPEYFGQTAVKGMIVANGADTTSGFDYFVPFQNVREAGFLAIDAADVDNGVIGGPNNTGDTALANADAVETFGKWVIEVTPVSTSDVSMIPTFSAPPTHTGKAGDMAWVDIEGGAKELHMWSDDAGAWVKVALT